MTFSKTFRPCLRRPYCGFDQSLGSALMLVQNEDIGGHEGRLHRSGGEEAEKATDLSGIHRDVGGLRERKGGAGVKPAP